MTNIDGGSSNQIGPLPVAEKPLAGAPWVTGGPGESKIYRLSTSQVSLNHLQQSCIEAGAMEGRVNGICR
jgi:hypothetical protein